MFEYKLWFDESTCLELFDVLPLGASQGDSDDRHEG